MEEQKDSYQPTGSEVVMTKDLSYSRLTLMPKDQREARIYYQSKLHEIADTYLLFSIAKWIGFVGVLQRNFEGINIISVFAVSSLILVLIRIAFYCYKDRSLRLFGYHLVILYGLDIVLFSIQ